MVFRLVGVTILLGVVYLAVDVGEVVEGLLAVPIWVVGLGIFFGLIRVGFMSLRWRILDSLGTETNGKLQLSQWDYFRFSLVTAIFSLFLPGIFGADAARAAWVVREVAEDRARRVIVIFFDRVLGLFSVLVLGFGAAIAAPGLQHREVYLFSILALILGLAAGLTVGVFPGVIQKTTGLCNHFGRLGRLLSNGVKGIPEVKATLLRNKAAILVALSLCFLVHFISFVLVYLAAAPLGILLPFTTLALMTSLSWVALLVPISVGGLGLRELSFVALLAPQGVGASDATAISLFQFGILVMVGLIGIPIVLLGRAVKTRR